MKAEEFRQGTAAAEAPGRNPCGAAYGAEVSTTTQRRTKAETDRLMEGVCKRGNLLLAYERVMKNK